MRRSNSLPQDRSAEPVNQAQYDTPADSEELAPLLRSNVIPSWNDSKVTVWRVTATLWCALVMGANDAAYGAIISYVSLPVLAVSKQSSLMAS